MRKIMLALLAAGLLFAPAAAQSEILIKFSHVVAEDTPKGRMANRFADLVHRRLPGKVRVEVYPSSQLFNDNNVLQALLLGDVQLAAPSLSKFGKYTRRLQLYDLPFLFKDMDAVTRFQNGPEGKSLLTSMADKGILGLGYLHNGLKQLSASQPLLVPEDARRLKFRIQSSDVLVAQFEALDAIPVKKPFSEVFTLLQTRAVDGQENTWSNIYSRKFFEAQSDITASNHGLLDYMVVTSTEFWNGLPSDIRPVVEEALREAVAYGNRVAAEKSALDRAAIEQYPKTTVHDLTPEQRAQWVSVMRPVWKQFEDEVGADMIKAALAANKGS